MATYTAPGVFVEEVPAAAPIVGVGTSTPAFIGVWDAVTPAAATVVPITNITQFKAAVGDFTTGTPAAGLVTLGHAVRGFFENGGTFCFVMRVTQTTDIAGALPKLEAYDDISMVAAPGVPATKDDTLGFTAAGAIIDHCASMRDRIAILDAPNDAQDAVGLGPLLRATGGFKTSDFAAVYTPWLTVFDDLAKAELDVPPSGHVAGVYARVDATRGVHKAPANEQLFGVLRPSIRIGKTQQGLINPKGGNCIRTLNGAIKIWGARTLADDTSLHKYVPIRRLLSFLYKSIDRGTQWAVFEPNGPDLWARIIRNVSSFLTNVWGQGALAGASADQAFYVKCDAENNPPDQRATGLLIVEVGVATVFPAEFVVFRIQQFTGPVK